LVYRFNFFVAAVSALAYTPLDEVTDYYKALLTEELPCVMDDIRHQLEVEEDEPEERFSEIQKSIERFLDYVESTYIGKVVKSGLKHYKLSKSGLKRCLIKLPEIRTMV
jgi:hypothetical protein